MPLRSSRAVRSGTWKTIDVTALVRAGSEISLALTTRKTSTVVIASRESKKRPKLIVKGTVDASAPAVELTAPTQGTVYTTPESVVVSASASDDTGVTRVDFYDNGLLAGRDSSFPFDLQWTVGGDDNGAHHWSVVAHDAAGNSVASGAVEVSVAIPDVTAPNGPPSLVGTSGATSVLLSWSASTDDVQVAGYRIYVDGIYAETTGATAYTVSGLACATTYTFAVEAYDAASNVSPKTSVTVATSGCSSASDPLWGMAGGYTSNQLTDMKSRGVRVLLLEIRWSEAEPQEGAFNENYLEARADLAATWRSYGYEVMLNFGLHHAPTWLLAKPNAKFVNQHGATYEGSDEPNLIFATDYRAYAERYTAKVFAELGNDFYAVRVGGGHFGELQYPAVFNPSTGRIYNYYWAFDGAAASTNPAPGWKPCDASPNGEAQRFLDWYLTSLTEYQNWQVATVRKSYPGPIAVLYASWGLRSGDVEKAAATNLCGTSSPEINGEVQRGYAHARHITALPDPNVAVWGTWAEKPGTISWLATLADAKGLLKMGENSGADTTADMDAVMKIARDNGLSMFLWIRASEAYCFCNGWATVEDYAARIASTSS